MRPCQIQAVQMQTSSALRRAPKFVMFHHAKSVQPLQAMLASLLFGCCTKLLRPNHEQDLNIKPHTSLLTSIWQQHEALCVDQHSQLTLAGIKNRCLQERNIVA